MLGKRVAWLAAACVAAVLAGGCGDDEVAGGGATADVAGYWVVSYALDGGGGMSGLMCLEQSGGAVSGMVQSLGITGSVSGSAVDLTAGDPGTGFGLVLSLTAEDADTMSGPFEYYEGGALQDTGTATHERFTPSGQFAASGTLGGEAVNVDTTTWGCGQIDDTGHVQIGYLTADLHIQMKFAPDVLSAGTFTVVLGPPAAGEISLQFSRCTPTSEVELAAESGTLQVDACNATGARGSFTLEFSGGTETVTGSFDVPWNVGACCLRGWETKAALSAGPRHALTVASFAAPGISDGRMYAMGGADLFTACEYYDAAGFFWNSAEDVPFQCRDARAVAHPIDVNAYVYLTGGHDNSAGTSVDSLYRFDPAAPGGMAWTTLPPMNQAREMHAAAALGDRIYVFGGRYDDGSTETTLASVEAYDVPGNSWDATVTDLPEALFGLTATTVGTKIYVIGGAQSMGGAIVDTVYEFDPAGSGGLGSYTEKAPMPTAKFLHGAAEALGRIYVTGGVTDVSAGPNAVATVEVYDTAADSWSAARDLPGARRMHGSCAIGTVVYVVGGEDETQHYDTTFALDTQ